MMASQAEYYPHVLQMYRKPPTGIIMFDKYQQYAIDRFKVLKCLEEAGLLEYQLYTEDWKNNCLTLLQENNLLQFINIITNTDADQMTRHMDHISHYVLQFVYCYKKGLCNWFVRYEYQLFRLRFMILSTESIEKFMHLNNLNFTPISAEEKENYKESLIKSTAYINPNDFDSINFYKISFNMINELCKNRSVYIKEGLAYVPSTQIIHLIWAAYRTELIYRLNVAKSILPKITDHRMNYVVLYLRNKYVMKREYFLQNNYSRTRLNMFNQISKKSIPLCMKNILNHLEENNHLKHYGRLQLGLFLKDIGFTLDDSITFWKRNFLKIHEDKFEKQYLYSIKYNYGLVGRKKIAASYNCNKILSVTPKSSECHGCPFQCFSSEKLKILLENTGFNVEVTQDVMSSIESKQYQQACSKYFAYEHKTNNFINIKHPNQYFNESQMIINKDNKKYIETHSKTSTMHKAQLDTEEISETRSKFNLENIQSQTFNTEPNMNLPNKIKNKAQDSWNDFNEFFTKILTMNDVYENLKPDVIDNSQNDLQSKEDNTEENKN